jgi:hypothetical protein
MILLRKTKIYMKKMQAILGSILVIFSLSSCAGSIIDKGGHSRDLRMAPSATIIRSSGYKKLAESDGESSTLFLLGFIPVTNPLNMEYAMSQAVQKIPGGQSLVNVVYWHEDHYYFPVGIVSVLKVEGTVVSLNPEPEIIEPPPQKRQGKGKKR